MNLTNLTAQLRKLEARISALETQNCTPNPTDPLTKLKDSLITYLDRQWTIMRKPIPYRIIASIYGKRFKSLETDIESLIDSDRYTIYQKPKTGGRVIIPTGIAVDPLEFEAQSKYIINPPIDNPVIDEYLAQGMSYEESKDRLIALRTGKPFNTSKVYEKPLSESEANKQHMRERCQLPNRSQIDALRASIDLEPLTDPEFSSLWSDMLAERLEWNKLYPEERFDLPASPEEAQQEKQTDQ